MRLRPLAALAAALLSAAALVPTPAAAQFDVPIRTQLPWRTLETEHFSFHTPAELEPWTRRQAERMEAVRASVARLVGYAPPGRTHVLVEDPTNDANGSAYPFLRSPGLFLWPVPPDPRSVIGEHRDWGELLLVHEYAHLAHLTRPSRNPLRRLLGDLSPLNLGPLSTGTPRWVWEGYATYVEGRLTGSGRPHGVWRPAILRQWALEGRLPSYAQLNGTAGVYGGSFAYLAGSAYFEWLVDRYAGARGDSVLPHLWRRLTARTPREFAAGFAGVFPGGPAELYARWTAEVTAEAVAAERRLGEAGLQQGRLVQRIGGYTGDPASSRDGTRIALAVRPTTGPRRIVVLRTDSAPPDTARARRLAQARERARRLDPEDVPAVEYLPRPLRVAATLPAVNGRAFDAPRFLADGVRLLVTRDEPRPDGVSRPDLWLWHSRTGALRRVTRGAAVRDADPSPDGRTALGTRCLRGSCDVVRIDLASGAVTTALAGDAEVTYVRPRWSPDGARFVAVAHRAGRWRLVVVETADGAARTLGPDDGADRYDADFTADGSALVVVSERGGVPNIERVELATGAVRTLTRVTGAAVAPTPLGPTGALLFLSMRSTGFDLHRISPDSVPPTLAPLPLTVAAVDTTGLTGPGALAVVERPPEAAPAFAAGPVRARGYGLGPRRHVLLPAGTVSADGEGILGALSSADPVGRLTWLLQGATGDATTWRGGSLGGTWRGARPAIEAQLFGAAQRVAPRAAADAAPALESAYHGALLAASIAAPFSDAGVAARGGVSAGRLALRGAATGDRTLAFGTARAGVTRGRGRRVASLLVGAHVAGGRTLDSAHARAIGTATLTLRAGGAAVRADYLRGVADRGAPAFERLSVGGPESALIDGAVLSQRIPMPALPTGTISDREIETVRVAVPGALLTPFAFAARAPGGGDWHRLAGAEASIATLGVPFARVPGVRAVAGAAYSFDAPLRRTWRGYLSVVLRP